MNIFLYFTKVRADLDSNNYNHVKLFFPFRFIMKTYYKTLSLNAHFSSILHVIFERYSQAMRWPFTSSGNFLLFFMSPKICHFLLLVMCTLFHQTALIPSFSFSRVCTEQKRSPGGVLYKICS